MHKRPTPAQAAFINCLDRHILLQASVGTGKTFALAHRVAKAVSSGVPPERVLCVTFTNRAAREMSERIQLYCPGSERVVTKTFHGLCAWILRLGAKKVGLPQDFVIVDEDDAQEIIRQLRLGSGLEGPEKVYHKLHDLKLKTRKQGLHGDAPADLQRYQAELRSMGGLDFADLIVETSRALAPGGPLWEDWRDRFALIQVDEMQDTHLAEYEIIARLAARAQSLVLVGDFDQTIYEWRGSTPDEVISRFRQDFPNVRRMTFTENHRSTRTLLEAAGRVATSFGGTPSEPVSSAVQGEPIVIHGAHDERGEASWIAQTIQSLHGEGVPYDRMGVLCRSNGRASVISQGLQAQGVPHLTVETYEFFRRQEVKDVMAYLRFLLNPEDSVSLRRILRRPGRGIGEATLEAVERMRPTGLRLADLASMDTFAVGDPFLRLIEAFAQDTVVIFDCETTGLDPSEDEIVELAAYKIRQGRHVDTFQKLLKPSKSVGLSQRVHGLSDELLQAQGEDPRRVLAEFAQFAQGALLVGHNARFDLGMLEGAARRHGVNFTVGHHYDTLALARRFIDARSYRLEDLAAQLHLEETPTHRAQADVAATFSLLKVLLPLAREQLQARQEFISKVRPQFVEFAYLISEWRDLLPRVRPAQLMEVVLRQSGLAEHYAKEPRRVENLRELHRTALAHDDLRLSPMQALESLTNFAALARNIDRMDLEGKVVCITVHQAKGLEFDVVFLAGMSEWEFPNYGALKQGRELEERRLFYVAVTRAKQRLFVSYFRHKNGKPRSESPYLRYLRPPASAAKKAGRF